MGDARRMVGWMPAPATEECPDCLSRNGDEKVMRGGQRWRNLLLARWDIVQDGMHTVSGLGH